MITKRGVPIQILPLSTNFRNKRIITYRARQFILKRQMPSEEKAKLSDYVIFTGGSYSFTKQQLGNILQKEGII